MKELIEEISELLYQENIDRAYGKLNVLINELIGWTATLSLDAQGDIVESLKPALSAMEDKDTTLLADILQYELLEKIEIYLG